MELKHQPSNIPSKVGEPKVADGFSSRIYFLSLDIKTYPSKHFLTHL